MNKCECCMEYTSVISKTVINLHVFPKPVGFWLKTLFNIVEERLKKLLNFDVSAV